MPYRGRPSGRARRPRPAGRAQRVEAHVLGIDVEVVATGTNGSVPLQAARAMVTNVIGAQRRRATGIGLPFPPRCWGDSWKVQPDEHSHRAYFPDENASLRYSSCGGLSGRSRAFTTRYHLHVQQSARSRCSSRSGGPCSPDHRRPHRGRSCAPRERRLGRRDPLTRRARAAVALGPGHALLHARSPPAGSPWWGGRGPRSRRDARDRRGGVSSHPPERAGRSSRAATRPVHT